AAASHRNDFEFMGSPYLLFVWSPDSSVTSPQKVSLSRDISVFMDPARPARLSSTESRRCGSGMEARTAEDALRREDLAGLKALLERHCRSAAVAEDLL